MSKSKRNSLSIRDKKELAYWYFVKDADMSQKEIAARVGTSEVTLCKWVNDGNWRKDRESLLVTKQKELRNMYVELSELNTHISNIEKEDPAYFKLAQIRRQLVKDIKNMEGDITKSTITDVFIHFGKWMQKNGVALEKVKEIVNLQDSFFKSLP